MKVRPSTGVYIDEHTWAATFDISPEEVKEHASDMIAQVVHDFVSERGLGHDPEISEYLSRYRLGGLSNE